MEKYEFENQRADEEVLMVRRRHPWVLWKAAFMVLLILILIFVAFLIWGASKVSVIILILGLVYIISFLLGRFFVYNNDIYILTSQRIININQSGFFTRRVSEAELENIQNVTYEIKGPIRSFLNFGEIIISTAGNAPGLTLKNVENPHFVQEKIVAQQKQSK
jgi:membrane protein YdbS with pleckstrin-like domain